MLSFMPTRWFTDADGDKFKKTDIFKRVAILNEIKNDQRSYLSYTVAQGETARDIAQRYYDDSEYFWILYLMNDMLDVYEDWPKSITSMQELIENKYGDSKYQVHHYETPNGKYRDLRAMRELYQFDSSVTDSEIISAFSLTPISNADYEEAMNDIKRTIKVLRKDYLDSVVDAVEEALSE